MTAMEERGSLNAYLSIGVYVRFVRKSHSEGNEGQLISGAAIDAVGSALRDATEQMQGGADRLRRADRRHDSAGLPFQERTLIVARAWPKVCVDPVFFPASTLPSQRVPVVGALQHALAEELFWKPEVKHER
jgi:proline racemase